MTDPGVESWIRCTTPEQRIRSIVAGSPAPLSAGSIAVEAYVSVSFADSYLEQLASTGILIELTDGDTTKYEQNPDYTRAQALRELTDSHDQDALVETRRELKEVIESTDEQWDRKLAEYRLSLVEDAIGDPQPMDGSQKREDE